LKDPLLNLLFYITLYNILLLIIFIRNRKGKLMLINSIPSLMICLPPFLAEAGFIFPAGEVLTGAGYVLFPLTCFLLITDYYPIHKKRHLITPGIIAALAVIISVLFPRLWIQTFFYYNLALFFYLILILRSRLFVKINITLTIFSAPVILVLFFIFSFTVYPFQSSLILIYLIVNLSLLYEYSNQTESLKQRFSSLNALNKRFDHVITRQKQNNDQLKKIIAQKDVELLQIARHASLAEITTGIAHELAQPLTGIKCISQNIIDDINYNELDLMQAVSDLSKISSLVDRSSSIIDHIRTFSRKRGFAFQPADLNACILNAIELVNNQMRNSHIDVEFILDETIPGIYGDNLSLEQLFINLILNSRDAITSRKETEKELNGRIKIMTGSNERNIWLIIEDNGCGIPGEIISKIWTPFFTTKRKDKGTGIGLSLSHRIIKEHNAEVSVDSSESGTVFTITFPVEPPSSDDEKAD